MSPVDLPTGIEHGTPAGHEAGCKGDRAECPALHTHGMTCTSAYVRSTTTPDRYFKAKARDPRPAAIARTLGYRPEPAPQPAQPLAESAHDRRYPEQPAGDADAPAEGPTPVERDAAGRREAMGHPTTAPKEPTMPAPKPRRKGHTPPPSASGTLTKEERAEVRTWAAAQGHQVPPRGRIAAAIVNAWLATRTTPDTTGAPAAPELDIAHRSDLLDQTRARIDEPTPTPRPDWAEVTIAEDVTTAQHERDDALALAALHQQLADRRATTAARLEQELAHTSEVNAIALEVALRKWDAERRAHDLTEAELAQARSANVLLLERIAALEELVEATPTQVVHVARYRDIEPQTPARFGRRRRA